MDKKKHKDNNSEDSTLFREAMRNVEEIQSRLKVTNQSEKKRKENLSPHRSQQNLDITENTYGERLLFQRSSLSKAKMRKLKRGKIRIDATIDLHGLSANEAEIALINFLDECDKLKIQCARIIHGKGYGSGPDGPVLKTLTDKVLRGLETVVGFCSAPENDGGTGALYVLISSDE
ncbi:MAG: Smr/MutS family protein [Pseudomonadota bacterium]|nr:Smr/MutS family protein [Pseudomonadota bacterium]